MMIRVKTPARIVDKQRHIAWLKYKINYENHFFSEYHQGSLARIKKLEKELKECEEDLRNADRPPIGL